MTDMTQTPAHAKTARRDHLWVLFVIAACALLEVWASWVTIGSMSGFPRIGGKHGLPTDWILAVTTEAYWGYALYAWLAAAPGPRSRAFAMWSAVAVFTLSLVGQAAAHLVKPGTPVPPALVVFVTAMPVIVLALIAVLIHMRQEDRKEAAETAERTAVQSEMDALRADLEAAQAALESARERAAEAEAGTAAAHAKAAELARKLELAKTRKTPRKPAPQRSAAGTRKPPRSETGTDPAETPAADPATEVPNDVDAQAEALAILAAEPDISGAKLAERVGMSERWGQTLKRNLAARTAGPDGPSGPA